MQEYKSDLERLMVILALLNDAAPMNPKDQDALYSHQNRKVLVLEHGYWLYEMAMYAVVKRNTETMNHFNALFAEINALFTANGYVGWQLVDAVKDVFQKLQAIGGGDAEKVP